MSAVSEIFPTEVALSWNENGETAKVISVNKPYQGTGSFLLPVRVCKSDPQTVAKEILSKTWPFDSSEALSGNKNSSIDNFGLFVTSSNP